MIVSSASPEDSIRANANGGILEIGSEYEKYSVNSANRFIEYIDKQPVIDLGCGDGAATRVFVANGNPTTGVDVSKRKLDRVEGAKKVNTDFVNFLSKPVDNVFMHHSLEHYVRPGEVLGLIAKWLKPGCYCYIAVPMGGLIHSTHFAVFDAVDELLPPGLEIIKAEEITDGWGEYRVIARKKK